MIVNLEDLYIKYDIDDNIIDISRSGFTDSIVCWFGVIATKYANITNIPATYTKNTIAATHVDDKIANIVDVMIAIIRSLSAAVIGFGANSIDDESKIIIDRIVDIIIYKFWGRTKSINFKG